MGLRHDYSGDFDPELKLSDFSRQALARLGREYLLNGHLQDRVGLPLVAKRFGGDAYVQFSIAEWMAASPIYSRRMQRAMGFEGEDVGTVFKNLQLDIGAPHQFMDFQFQLDGPDRGEFWLPHCGALLDVEPFGEERVRLMCHDIEDPTFDATAAATHTTIGNDNYLMSGAHLGHDVILGDKNILSNNVLLAGFVEVGNGVVIGGACAFHQFIKIGDYVMAQGLAGSSKDVPPYCTENCGAIGALRGTVERAVPAPDVRLSHPSGHGAPGHIEGPGRGGRHRGPARRSGLGSRRSP